ncbi:lipid-A-disaccharide synthase [Psychrobacter ciconiae]|uniref:lipid-A-disaccharide synthase n=1 Tax=Psychrobacter ciconiae TaxID=1553449 RepID=UPI001917DE10|nr:lipid-A-disaccharide synthase [Psychrobacter ciconiae]
MTQALDNASLINKATKPPNFAPLVIGIVAGEVSGDSLGADFMAQMNNLCGDIIWVGVGGAKMQAQGLNSLFPLSRLAVMGLVEIAGQLNDLFKARRELLAAFETAKIDWFVGIDAPDFNLRVAKKLKPKGVFCVQYVSPSIWAWRESRIHGIKAATDLVLCLFPFELDVYERHHHPAVCVGHPLLHTIDPKLLQLPKVELQSQIFWQRGDKNQSLAVQFADLETLICVMPGSRRGEIAAILPLMLAGIVKLMDAHPQLKFVIPAVDKSHQELIERQIQEQAPQLQAFIAVIFDDQMPNLSQQVMAASDIVLLASGTATLEAMLLERPMVVVYRLNALTYQLAKRLIKVPFVALPNILAGQFIVTELIQEQASPTAICQEISKLLPQANYKKQQQKLQATNRNLAEQSSQSPATSVIDAWFYR